METEFGWAFWLSIVAIIVMMGLSAFFSISETSLTTASRARMHALAQKGNARARMVNRIREQRDRMLGALLLGDNLANILASALATSILIAMFGEGGVFYATIIMTVLLVIFSEVLPKTFALYHADRAAMWAAPFARWVIIIFSPLAELISKTVRFLLRLMGTDIDKVTGASDLDELRGVIDLHDGGADETVPKRAMLRSILDLDTVTVSEIMIHRKNIMTIDMKQDLDPIIQQILDSPFTRIPVWRDNADNITGIIHAKALLRELQSVGGHRQHVNVDALAVDPWFVPATTTLADQLKAFRERREYLALVVDEYGTLLGMVTLEDILEEIVGDIGDSPDVRIAGVRAQPNGSFLIDGAVTIRDLNREFDWVLPSENYSTIAGLILYEAKTIPDAGQVFTFHGFRFDVMRRNGNQITLVRVTPVPAAPE